MDRLEKLLRRCSGKKDDADIIRFSKEVTDYFPEVFDEAGNFRPEMKLNGDRGKFIKIW